ncbi:Unknown protein, partial [Striga hermonthica]
CKRRNLLLQTDLSRANTVILKSIKWKDVTLPEEWILEGATWPESEIPPKPNINLRSVTQYRDGQVALSFDRIYELRYPKSPSNDDIIDLGRVSQIPSVINTPTKHRFSTSDIPSSSFQNVDYSTDIPSPFENMVVLHRYNDPVQCRAFLTTSRGSSQNCFHQLPLGAIKDFDGFSSSFLNQFSSVRPQEKSYLTLMGIQQKEGESLRDYVARYTRACIEVPRASEEIKAGGLTRGLLPGLCRNSLAKRQGRTFDEVLGRCAKYMNVEEVEADFLETTKVIKTDSRDERRERKNPSTGERKGSPRTEREGRPRNWRPTQYTPLEAPQARILEVMEREIRDIVNRDCVLSLRTGGYICDVFHNYCTLYSCNASFENGCMRENPSLGVPYNSAFDECENSGRSPARCIQEETPQAVVPGKGKTSPLSPGKDPTNRCTRGRKVSVTSMLLYPEGCCMYIG